MRGEARDRERAGEGSCRARDPGITPRAPGPSRAVSEDLLDRRGEHYLVAVVAESLRDRARVAAVANDRRAREALADSARVNRRARCANEDARSAQPCLGPEHVEHLDV